MCDRGCQICGWKVAFSLAPGLESPGLESLYSARFWKAVGEA